MKNEEWFVQPLLVIHNIIMKRQVPNRAVLISLDLHVLLATAKDKIIGQKNLWCDLAHETLGQNVKFMSTKF